MPNFERVVYINERSIPQIAGRLVSNWTELSTRTDIHAKAVTAARSVLSFLTCPRALLIDKRQNGLRDSKRADG